MNTPVLRQSWVVSAILLNVFAQGMMASYPSSLVPGLLDPKSSIKAELNTTAWLGSCAGLVFAVGALMSSVLMNFFGRKLAHFFCTVPGMIGFLLIYFATDIPTIMCGRLLTGTTTGAIVSLAAVIIGEYTNPKYRGVFLHVKTAAVCIGSMFLHVISFHLSWRAVALVAVVPHAIVHLMTLTWPESPAWLASRQQYMRSEQAFYWLRGRDEASRKEINEMITSIKKSQKFHRKLTIWNKVANFLKKFTLKDFMMPLMIIVVSKVLLEACGRHYFPAYALQIIGAVADNKTQSFYYTIIIDAIITASSIFSSVLVKIMKRRTLVFSTGFAAVAVLATVCFYLYLISLGMVSNERSWIPISLFMVYFVLVNLGCTPLPAVLLGEVFPLAHREAGITVSGVCVSLIIMGAMQLTPHMLVVLGIYGTFSVFGAVMAVSLAILYFTLPETKDKTLLEIEKYFKFGKYIEDTNNYEEAKTKMMDSEE